MRKVESAESASKLAAANNEIQELKARGSSRMEAKEIYSDNEKQKDVEIPKGKQAQIMKDIELDQISTCPPYGTGVTLYPLGNGGNAELERSSDCHSAAVMSWQQLLINLAFLNCAKDALRIAGSCIDVHDLLRLL